MDKRADRTNALRASAYVLVGRGLRASARVLAVLVLARAYTPAAVADFAFVFLVATIVGIVSDLGLGELAVREIAAHPAAAPQLERRIIRVRLATLLPALAVSCGIAIAAGVEPAAAFGSSAFAVALIATDLYASIRRGHRRHGLEALECALPLAAIGVGTIAASIGSPLASFHLLVGGTATLFVVVRALALLHGTSGLAEHVSIWDTVRSGGWLLARTLVTWLLLDGVVVLLRELSTPAQLAIYAVGARPVGLMMQMMAVLPMVFYPALSKTKAGDTERLAAQTNQLNLLHIAVIPAVFAAALIAGDILLHLSGEEYAAGRSVLRVLAIGTLLYAGTLSTIPLVVLRRERAVVVAAAVGVVVLFVSGVLLVPRDGALGAALAAGAAFAACKIALVVAYRSLRLPLGDWRHLPSLALVAAYLTAAALLDGTAGYVVIVGGGAASLAISLWLLYRTRLSS